MGRKLFDHLRTLTTETRNPRSAGLDALDIPGIVELINAEDKKVAIAVEKILPQVVQAVEIVAGSFKAGGRLIYAGAGTSGRLGVLDAAECPPTFGVSPKMVRGIIAGGRQTLIRSREGVEDDVVAAKRDLARLIPDPADTVFGIAASGRTPYPLAVLQEAKREKTKTIFLVCNEMTTVPRYVDLIINPIVGPEILTGSTRMKAATACKMILNMVTTTSMVQVGKCYGNLMVDLKATSAKLAERSRGILIETTGISYREAGRLLLESHGEVKTAIAMKLLSLDYRTAKRRLTESGGRLAALLKP
jgi:N-acetylmuramic acid 6-phosphate etherase